jgi:spore germination protein YaaH
MISKTIDRVKKGDTVVVISSDGKYARVRTENGKIGYIKAKKIDNEFTVRENMEEEKQVEGKINLTWDYFSTVASSPDRTGTTIDGVNVVSPAFFYLGEDGKLKENVGNSGKEYIEWAHENGYKVWPMVSNAEAAQTSLNITSKIMNSYEERQNLIESIVDVCVEYKLDGINIDFENMKQEDKDMYSRFIIELTPRLKEIGLVTSVDVTAPDGGETWSLCFDRNVIGDVADYIVFMAYDQNGVSSTNPGTTAGYNWVKLSLNKFLTTEEIESDKIILAIPFYTRVWTTDSNGEGKTSSKTISMKNIQTVIPNNAQKTWDDDLKQYYVEYTEGSNKKQIWIEDIDSLKAKVSLITENNLAGVGSWQKDMETDDVWQMLKDELQESP